MAETKHADPKQVFIDAKSRSNWDQFGSEVRQVASEYVRSQLHQMGVNPSEVLDITWNQRQGVVTLSDTVSDGSLPKIRKRLRDAFHIDNKTASKLTENDFREAASSSPAPDAAVQKFLATLRIGGVGSEYREVERFYQKAQTFLEDASPETKANIREIYLLQSGFLELAKRMERFTIEAAAKLRDPSYAPLVASLRQMATLRFDVQQREDEERAERERSAKLSRMTHNGRPDGLRPGEGGYYPEWFY